MDHPSAGRELTSIYRSDFAAINGPVSRDRAQLPVWGLSRLVSDWTPSLVCPTVASSHLGHVTMVPWAPVLRWVRLVYQIGDQRPVRTLTCSEDESLVGG